MFQEELPSYSFLCLFSFLGWGLSSGKTASAETPRKLGCNYKNTPHTPETLDFLEPKSSTEVSPRLGQTLPRGQTT